MRDSLGTKSYVTQDEASFTMLAEAYAKPHPSMNIGEACGARGPTGLVHGGEVAENEGALMDYLYFKHHTLMVRMCRRALLGIGVQLSSISTNKNLNVLW